MSKRTLLLNTLAALITVSVLEGIAFVGLKIHEHQNPGAFINRFIESHFDTLSDDYHREYVKKAYHPQLGWDNEPGSTRTSGNAARETWSYSINEKGAREGNPYANRDPGILTYGDSFTLCAEVDDDETWQVFLSESIQQNVVNYGVNGYGTAQALLKLESHLASGQTASKVILGIHEFNIGRVVNGFRPFALPQTGAKLGFKPAFVPAGRGVDFHPNPFRPGMNLDQLREAAYRVAAYDYWASRKVVLEWPYTWVVLKLAHRLTRDDTSNDYRRLWRSDEGKRVMREVVSRFVRLTARHDIQPVLLLIPDAGVIKHGKEPVYAGFLEDIGIEYPDLTVVDISRSDFDPERFNILPFKGHASAYGNRVIADALRDALARH